MIAGDNPFHAGSLRHPIKVRRVIFIHSWNVVDTSTDGLLREALTEQTDQCELKIEFKHIWLGPYIVPNTLKM